MARPRRPENARVGIVASGSSSARASAQAGLVPASRQRKKAVPICTALAPKIKAAAIPREIAALERHHLLQLHGAGRLLDRRLVLGLSA